MAAVRNFEVMSDKFNADRICTSAMTSSQKQNYYCYYYYYYYYY
jgi:hypothetical protein